MDKQKALEQINAELDSEVFLVGCYKHFYFGPSKSGAPKAPTSGCVECWKTFWIHDLKNVPPEQRGERLAEAFEVISNLNRAVETGKFDYTPYRHAKVEYERVDSLD